jgi:hypothetical protein
MRTKILRVSSEKLDFCDVFDQRRFCKNLLKLTIGRFVTVVHTFVFSEYFDREKYIYNISKYDQQIEDNLDYTRIGKTKN